jgi:hypothetical protein
LLPAVGVNLWHLGKAVFVPLSEIARRNPALFERIVTDERVRANAKSARGPPMAPTMLAPAVGGGPLCCSSALDEIVTDAAHSHRESRKSGKR